MGTTRQASGAAFLPGDDEKFACIVFNIRRDLTFDTVLRLDAHTWVLPQLPCDVGERWSQWIGTIGCDQIRSSNCILWTKGRSEQPHVYDAENKALVATARRVFYGLLLQGIFPSSEVYTLTGGGSIIRSRSSDGWYLASKGTVPRGVGRRECETALAAAQGLRTIFSSSGFERLRRGFTALMQAVRLEHDEDRLHHYVRALDGVIKLQEGQGYNDFGRRCTTFMEPDDLCETFAGCYLMRNNVEHMNFWGDDLKRDKRRIVRAKGERIHNDTIVAEHLRLIEALALGVYLCTTTSKGRADVFKSDIAIDRFWRKSERGAAGFGGAASPRSLTSPRLLADQSSPYCTTGAHWAVILMPPAAVRPRPGSYGSWPAEKLGVVGLANPKGNPRERRGALASSQHVPVELASRLARDSG
jgi:hypothetical protein